MTTPRYGDRVSPNGLGENPIPRLEAFMAVCREVAKQTDTPLVDHYDHWTRKRDSGQELDRWMTDSVHPNGRGNQEIRDTMLKTLLEEIAAAEATRP